jgi:N-acyl homoserine lactone hydrolase
MPQLLKGLPARMAILDYGLFQVHQNGRIIGICGYVIETTAGETVLIDTGFPAKYARNPSAAAAEDGLAAFGKVLSLSAENLAPAQLGRLGLTPADIDLMIQSHTHIDHVGFMGAFAGVPIVIAEAERALPRPLYWTGRTRMEWPAADYVTISSDAVLGPGFEVLLVPGHASGQLAFAFSLPETGPVILTSDAISRASEIDTRFADAWDPDLALHHANRLIARAVAERAMLIYGHSPEQWPQLRKAPDWYG